MASVLDWLLPALGGAASALSPGLARGVAAGAGIYDQVASHRRRREEEEKRALLSESIGDIYRRASGLFEGQEPLGAPGGRFPGLPAGDIDPATAPDAFGLPNLGSPPGGFDLGMESISTDMPSPQGPPRAGGGGPMPFYAVVGDILSQLTGADPVQAGQAMARLFETAGGLQVPHILGNREGGANVVDYMGNLQNTIPGVPSVERDSYKFLTGTGGSFYRGDPNTGEFSTMVPPSEAAADIEPYKFIETPRGIYRGNPNTGAVDQAVPFPEKGIAGEDVESLSLMAMDTDELMNLRKSVADQLQGRPDTITPGLELLLRKIERELYRRFPIGPAELPPELAPAFAGPPDPRPGAAQQSQPSRSPAPAPGGAAPSGVGRAVTPEELRRMVAGRPGG